jgi:hypothetical protein
MGMSDEVEPRISKLRLRGQPIPADVMILLAHNQGLFERTGVQLNWDEGWAPWLDTSYLRPEELANPDIAANIRAIEEVCSRIAFVAAHEDAEYYGYWLGTEDRPVSESPVVCLDNEGQFRLCPGSNLAEALLERTCTDDAFDELRQWFEAIGIPIQAKTISGLGEPAVGPTPGELHASLYRKYLGAR